MNGNILAEALRGRGLKKEVEKEPSRTQISTDQSMKRIGRRLCLLGQFRMNYSACTISK